MKRRENYTYIDFVEKNIVPITTLGYVIITALFFLFIFFTPFVYKANPSIGKWSYIILAPTCHQLTQRSFCVFFENDSFRKIDNCLQETVPVYTKEIVVQSDGMIGYKFPVCSRCMSIYLGMVLGIVFYLLKKDKHHPPPLWLFIILILPLALDGGSQLIGLRKSFNTLRFITGLIAGIAVPVYLLPILIAAFTAFLNDLKKPTFRF